SKVQSPKSFHLAITLDQTPFYAESGGQIADTGTISGGGFEGRVVDVIKQHGVFIHEVEPTRLQVAPEELKGLEVEAQIDVNRRMRIMRNHTATHLLHAALRQVLGKHVTQAGSYVGPDHLRFDFTHGKPMTPEELAMVEVIVNEKALWNAPVTTHVDLPIAEAKAKGAMALFGEKYGDTVRMVEIGDFSRELCGGTHLRATGEIGLFKITSEASAASGVRRIEAVTGEGAYAWVLEQTGAFYEAAARLKSTPKDVLSAVDRLHEQLREEKRRREKAETALARGETGGVTETQEIKGVFLWTRKFEGVDQKIAASAVDDAVAQNPKLVALAVVTGERMSLICKAGPDAIAKGAHAGNLIKQVAPIVGGGGGGRPEFATAGGKFASKVVGALAASAGFLGEMLG
ncbi:MAG: DHHA1 domain-containing protein, partial [Fimbriimonadales bacterium]